MPPWQILLYKLINEDHSIRQYIELFFVPYGQHLCLEIDQILGDWLVAYSAVRPKWSISIKLFDDEIKKIKELYKPHPIPGHA